MAGYYHERAAAGVHDDLYAKAIVLEAGNERAALVALDLISTTRPLVEEARRKIEKATGIPGANVMISATHAHTGPVLRDRSARTEALGGASDKSAGYLSRLPEWIAESVSNAQTALTPASAAAAIGHEDSIAFNRRFHMRDGSVGWNPGKLNPGIIKPAGPIDPSVPFVYFATSKGEPIATYVNYAVHLDNVGGLQISADLPYTLSRSLAAFKGTNMLTVFTAGTCGDVNHINVRWKQPQKGHENAARMGTILAGEVLRRWPELEPIEAGSVRVRSEIVHLPLPELAANDVEKARAIVRRYGGKDEPKFLEKVWAFKVLDIAAREGKPLEVEVQTIVLGNVAWVSLPGEIFVELGLRIKQDSPFPYTIIAELANGSIGYVPSRRAYPQGNYEVVSARCAEGSGELLADTAVKLLWQLHSESE